MMEEVISRRIKNIKLNEQNLIPDVIIIDGGRGQFNRVMKILKKYKQENVKLLSLSKGPNRNAGREIIHLENKNVN